MQMKLLIILVCSAYAQVDLPEDARLNFTGLANKYGQKSEEFDVVTKDGYILQLFHITGDRRKPVLLIHGILDSSDGFIIRGNLSLAINLAKNGYDIWAINNRGNRYSRRHLTLNPDTDSEFWNFSVQEFGNRDLPPTIDFVLDKTGAKKISIIGYSEGTTSTLVLGATRPEYNDKVNLFIALAPICFLHHMNSHMAAVIRLAPNINRGLRMMGTEELVGYSSPIKNLINTLCSVEGAGYELCVRGVVFQLTGVDAKQFEPSFFSVWLGHYPAGTSRKNFFHFAQMGNRKRFTYYDYGAKKNLAAYGSKSPPDYELGRVTMKTAIFVAKNDGISTVKDVQLLRKTLPNVVEYKVMKYKSFNHLDFVWGRTTYSLVLPQVLEVLNKYT